MENSIEAQEVVKKGQLYCNFCCKPQTDVRCLITGGVATTAFVCNECVALMVELIRERYNPNFMAMPMRGVTTSA